MYIQPYSRCVCRVSIIKINRYPVKLSSAVDRDRARFSVLTMKAINHQRCMSSKARRPSQQLPSLFLPLVVQYATIFVNENNTINISVGKKCILCFYLSAASKMIPCLVIFLSGAYVHNPKSIANRCCRCQTTARADLSFVTRHRKFSISYISSVLNVFQPLILSLSSLIFRLLMYSHPPLRDDFLYSIALTETLHDRLADSRKHSRFPDDLSTLSTHLPVVSRMPA